MSIEEGDYIETTARWGKRFVEVINPNKTDEILRFYFNQPEAEQDEPVAWEALTKVTQPKGTPRTIFTDKVRADEWLSDFVEGAAWLKPLVYQNTELNPRKPLTDEQIDDLARTMVKGNKSVNWLARAIEAAHGIKE